MPACSGPFPLLSSTPLTPGSCSNRKFNGGEYPILQIEISYAQPEADDQEKYYKSRFNLKTAQVHSMLLTNVCLYHRYKKVSKVILTQIIISHYSIELFRTSWALRK